MLYTDHNSQNSIDTERKVFLTKLKTNPIFLLRHLSALSRVAISRLRGTDRGKAARPAWLRDINSLGGEYPEAGEALARIPARKIPAVPAQPPVEIINDNIIKTIQDPEDYFAAHRFSGLINDLDSASLPASVINWIRNPPPETDAAWETYSSCERAANLLTWLSFHDCGKMRDTDLIIAFLWKSMHWIYNHLEYYGRRTGNHILNNARALIMGGAVLANPHAIEAGMRILKHMLPVLLQPDGSLRERSSHYQLIIFTWLLDAYAFLRHVNYPSEKLEFLRNTIMRVRNVASMLCDADGYLQAYVGDISPDSTPQTTSARLAVCYPEFWPARTRDQSLDDWYIIANNGNKVILNCPQGQYPETHPAHCHNDITSFVWLYKNQPILIDSGRSRYTKEATAILQKSARGHNVPFVNHFAPVCESLVINGNWWPAPYANAKLSLDRNFNSVIITHDGFRRMTPVKKHSRTILVDEDNICVSDNFTGSGRVEINILWQFHPSFKDFAKETLVLGNEKIEITIDAYPQVESVTVEQGWASTQYGYAQSNLVLITRWVVNLPFTATLIFKVKKCAA